MDQPAGGVLMSTGHWVTLSASYVYKMSSTGTTVEYESPTEEVSVCWCMCLCMCEVNYQCDF